MSIIKECRISLSEVDYVLVECPTCKTQTRLPAGKRLPHTCGVCQKVYPEHILDHAKDISKIIKELKEYIDQKSISLVKIEE